MTPAHRIEIILSEDGKLSLDQLPFRAGQAVEVIVLPITCLDSEDDSLHGKLLRYDRPTEPVAETEWGVLQ